MAEEQRNHRFWLETALIFGGWAVFGLVLATQGHMQSGLRGRPVLSWADALRPSVLETLLWLVSTFGIFWLVRRFPLERGRVLPGLAVHAVGAVVMSLARTGVWVLLGQHVSWIGERDFKVQFWGTSTQNFSIYGFLVGIAHLGLYSRRYREREQAAERLARGLTEARLQALKMQLQPHFLFNTLNAISALIPDDAKPARRMLARLGDLLRFTLEHEETQEVTLREELAFLEPYLEIEQARLEDRLTVVMKISPETLEARVPHLILQPLVENAIRHGIAARIEPGRVEISATRAPNDGALHLEVRDDGRGVDRGHEVRTRRGVGLTNIRSRLEQLYNGEHRFELENHVEGGVLVRVTLPFRRGGNGGGTEEAAGR
jgi:two-component system, LytTR family, sensor kinase